MAHRLLANLLNYGMWAMPLIGTTAMAKPVLRAIATLPPLPSCFSVFDNSSPMFALQPTTPGSTAVSRDPLVWPFSTGSIWNQPIGSEAVYVDAQLQAAPYLEADIDYFYVLDGDDPLRPVYALGGWSAGRSTGVLYQGIALPIPDTLMVADANYRRTANNSAAFLMPDGRTLVQVNGLTRDQPEGPVYGWRAADEDIYGAGIQGGHAGSGLSSIGGTLRRGELTGPDPIRHALKINLFGEAYLAYTKGTGGGLGNRWPATKADAYVSPERYGGTLPGLMMGTLLAIPPDVMADQIGLQTEAGHKLFAALQDYGAYVADNTNRDAHAIAVQSGVPDEFIAHYGYPLETPDQPFYQDVMALFQALHIVDNNAPDRVGGGGVPRAPLAPPLTPPDMLADTPFNNVALSAEEDVRSAGLSRQVDWVFDPDETSEAVDRILRSHRGRRRQLDEEYTDLLAGSRESDYLVGSDRGDLIKGRRGPDWLFGEGGDDALIGGPGNDYLGGGGREDRLWGGRGDDMLSGGYGYNWLHGGSGTDTLLESADLDLSLRDDRLEMGRFQTALISIEAALLSGGDSDNVLDAADFSGASRLDGGEGNDTLRASLTDSTLLGGTGADILIGGPGNDTLVGANELQTSGIDRLTGGAGQDQFVLGDFGRGNPPSVFYTQSPNRTITGPNYAWITDFNPAEDILLLPGNIEQYSLSSKPCVAFAVLESCQTGVVLSFLEKSQLIAVLTGEFDPEELSLSASAFRFE
ncbi:MAG: calcium-binding protein [Cyanobacteria bacterium J06554_6]